MDIQHLDTSRPQKLAKLYKNISKVFKPVKKKPFHEWVENNYVLPPNLAPEAFQGLVDFSTAPYLRVIARALSEWKQYPGNLYQITIMKGSQVYITTLATSLGFYFLIEDQQKQLWVFPTDSKGGEWMRTNFKSSWREMDSAIRQLGDPDNEKQQQAKLLSYPNGFLKIVSPKGGGALQGTPANIMIVDEPSSVDTEVSGLGDTLTNLKGRPKNFPHAIMFIGGTPGDAYYDEDGVMRGGILINEYNKSQQCIFHFPCPACGHDTTYPVDYDDLKRRLIYDVDKDGMVIDGTARVVCSQCKEPAIDEAQRRQINIKYSGISECWKPTNPLAPEYHKGYNVNTFLSLAPQVSLDKLARHLSEAVSEIARQALCNTNGFPYIYSKGESAKDSMTQDKWVRFLTKTVDNDGQEFNFDVPIDVNTVIAAADIQDGNKRQGTAARIEVVYVGFDIFGRTYVIDRDIFLGSVTAHPLCRTWLECSEKAKDGLLMDVHRRAIQRRFKHESGQEIGLSAFGFDLSNGSHYTKLKHLVNNYPEFVGGKAKFRNNPIVFALRGGSDMKDRLVTRTGESVKLGARAKPAQMLQIYNRLNINTKQMTHLLYNDILKGDVLFADIEEFDDDFFTNQVMTQLWVAEKGIYLKGEKNNKPNEVDDCLCYARAILYYCATNYALRGSGGSSKKLPLIDMSSNELKYNPIENRRERFALFCKRHGIKIDEEQLADLTLIEFGQISQAMIRAVSTGINGKIDTKPIVDIVSQLNVGMER